MKKLKIIKFLISTTNKCGVIEKINAPKLAKKFKVTRQYVYKCFKLYKNAVKTKK